MTGIIHFETFLITGILLNITPGNDTIFILTRLHIYFQTKAGWRGSSKPMFIMLVSLTTINYFNYK
jgi:hypothetical protein